MKFPEWIYVTFDREVWRFPAIIVAEKRADYYACTVDGYEKFSGEWYSEFKESFDRDNLIDWAHNNMNWIDVKDVAVQCKSFTEKDYAEMWTNADMDVE